MVIQPARVATSAFKGISALSFDLDDCLFPFAPALKAASLALYKYLKEECNLSIGDTEMRAAWFEAAKSYPSMSHDVTALRRIALQSLLGSDSNTLHVERAMQIFLHERSQAVELYPDTLPSLKALKSAGYRIVACTNGNADVSVIGIGDLFEAGILIDVLYIIHTTY